jgi:methylphosphotriester-DNA--protein-cysteine methyltransferase
MAREFVAVFDPEHPLADVLRIATSITVAHDEVRRPCERCAEMLARSLRAKSKGVAKAYLGAAQWFALAAEDDPDG